MPVPLLATKLFIPILRETVVQRQRLVDLLNNGLTHKLILISAPAGFGKTTLLSSWLSRGVAPAAWLSLDQGDNDPARFLAYIIKSLQTIFPDLGERILESLQSPQADYSESTLIALINEISTGFSKDFVLVLDDYHVLSSQAVFRITNFLLANIPPKMHLVIATRADPDLPLPRLRGSDELVEIRQNDLRFTFQEVTQFINQMLGSKLTTQDIAALTTRTEGWIAGLQMAVLSMSGKEDISRFVQDLTGSDRYILDYLVEEVLEGQPEDIQNFLLQTSIIAKFNALLCNAITKTQNSQEILEQFERGNLFILPLDNERVWYRYHQLFADLLQKRLEQEQPENVPELHDRASRWFEDRGLIGDAIQHSLTSRNYDRAAELVDQVTEETLMRSEIETFLSWTRALPESVITTRPNLGIGLAWALLISGDSLERSEKILGELTCNTDDLKGRMNVVLSSIAIFRGQLSEARETAISLLPENDVRLREMAEWTISYTSILDISPSEGIRTLRRVVEKNQASGNLMGAAAALWQISRLYTQQGKLSQAKRILEKILEQAQDQQGNLLPIAGEAMMGMGELYREANQLKKAEKYLKKGIALSKKGRGITAYLGYISLARVRMAQGDTDSADNLFQEAKQFTSFGFDQLLTAASEAKAKILNGEIDTAERWLGERGLVIGEFVDSETDNTINKHMLKYEHLLHVRVLLARNQNKNILNIIKTIQEKMEQQGRIDLLIEIHVLKALAYRLLGNFDEAISALEMPFSVLMQNIISAFL
jgi:LuxR family maltose regulon positive regulatory protein